MSARGRLPFWAVAQAQVLWSCAGRTFCRDGGRLRWDCAGATERCTWKGCPSVLYVLILRVKASVGGSPRGLWLYKSSPSRVYIL